MDLSKEPIWFRVLSPLGDVPMLKVAQRGPNAVIFESAVILEYHEETQARPLRPADPLERARHRSWIEFGSQILNGIARAALLALIAATASVAGLILLGHNTSPA